MLDAIPQDPAFDATPAFLRDGYLFVTRRCERLGSDAFRARLMLREIVCMRGHEAAEIFYDGRRFSRQHAMPPTTVSLLQGKESVQAFDGAAHRHRKAMFMDLMTPDALERAAGLFARAWRARAARWEGDVVLHDEARLVLTSAALAWTGLEEDEEATRVLATELSAMIDAAASFGPHYVEARVLRERCEAWARGVIDELREGRAAADGPARRIAEHRDPSGQPLEVETAAVELINLLRPTVAVGRFVVFLALEMHRHPEWRERLAGGDGAGDGGGDAAERRAFVQEVRRTAPFFPVIAGTVREPFAWRGHAFEEGDWVMLDLYGTNRDPRIWAEPDAFRPERFLDREVGPFDIVPQGGGDFLADHRCPGEWLTIRLLEEAVRLLLATPHDVPEQDLTVDLSRMPALPASHLVIRPR